MIKINHKLHLLTRTEVVKKRKQNRTIIGVVIYCSGYMQIIHGYLIDDAYIR